MIVSMPSYTKFSARGKNAAHEQQYNLFSERKIF